MTRKYLLFDKLGDAKIDMLNGTHFVRLKEFKPAYYNFMAKAHSMRDLIKFRKD